MGLTAVVGNLSLSVVTGHLTDEPESKITPASSNPKQVSRARSGGRRIRRYDRSLIRADGRPLMIRIV